MSISTTALMLNADGSVYHLHAFPEDIGSIIILVGDPNRTNHVAQHFDSIDVKRFHREFILQTGWLNNKRITVIGTGIGCDNIDIVMNELDALVNIDLKNKTIKKNLTQLKIIRLGTAGALHPEIALNTLIMSSYAFSMEGLLNYYQHEYSEKETQLFSEIRHHFKEFPMRENLYLSAGSELLLKAFQSIASTGITFTCCGFYGPQHRQIRAPIIQNDILKTAQQFWNGEQRILNFEMETAAIYGLGKLLNHHCCSISTIVTNRINDTRSTNADKAIDQMIEQTLAIISDCVSR